MSEHKFKIDQHTKHVVHFDRVIIFTALLLILISIVLISSASVQEAFTTKGDSYYYFKRQLVFVSVAVVWGLLMTSIPSKAWFDAALPLLGIALFLMVLVLIIGREVNEAKRWIAIGPINLQPAEILKLVWIIYFSSYASRKIEMVRHEKAGFIKPMMFLVGISFLLLLQPDFVAGAGLLKYLITLCFVAAAGGLMIIFQPYRIARVTSFLDPWQDRFGSGYQLTQSLMAFGRGGLTGDGIGNSIHKLGYLPEAHTDFITSILGEECGFIGVCFVIFLEFIIVTKAIILATRILRQRAQFQGYVAFAIGLFFCLQTVINIGAASGGLPTKGLTLPLVSYGGSSLVVCIWAVAILLRIDYEWRTEQLGEFKYNNQLVQASLSNTQQVGLLIEAVEVMV